MFIVCGKKKFRKTMREYKRLARENKYLKAESGNYYHKLRDAYEHKKLELLDAHRQSKDLDLCLKLVHEINALNEILKLGKINEDNIADTLLGYPNYKHGLR